MIQKNLKRWINCGCCLVYAGLTAHADTTNLSAAADTFILNREPGINAGGHGWLDGGTDGQAGTRRGLLRFDLSILPPGSTVTSVVLQARLSRVPANGPVPSNFALHRLNNSWGEGTKIGNNGSLATAGEATWNSRLTGTANWTAPGALSDAAATASAVTMVGSAANTIYSWSGEGLVADVQHWVNTPAQNHGWLLRSQDEGTPFTARGFASRESGAGPVLVVGYTPGGNSEPPSVAITSPVSGTSVSAPAMVTIEATASSTSGSIVQVDFFDGDTLLGLDSQMPYSIDSQFFPGLHALTAVALDSVGARATSAVVNLTVTNQVIANPFAERIPKGSITVELETIADGMASPLGMAVPDDGSGRMFVFDQDGHIWVVTAGGRIPVPLLDVSARLVLQGAYDERGLLGLAVHPNFAQNPLIYTYTSETNAGPAHFQTGLTNNNHQSVITEWRISAGNSNLVDLASRREILRIDQPQSNHNGGAMHFGPDGYLYITLGDGGSANDVAAGHVPGGNAQSLEVIWGKLIRIDVHGNNGVGGQYGIPLDNPFVGKDGLDEIFAYGLRNPFSFSFDNQNGQLWLTDVGQNRVEEVNVITSGGNYGWNLREGSFWFDPASGSIVTAPVRPAPQGMVDPVAEYDHDDGQAIIGGYVYRGSAIPALAGRYVFGDWGTFSSPAGRLYYLDETNGVKELRIGLEDRSLGLWLKGYGQGPDGELYLFATKWLGPAGNTGRMLKIVPLPAVPMISTISASGTNLSGSIQGGQGPFVVQRKASLEDMAWSTETITTGNSFAVPKLGNSGFVRVRDAFTTPAVPLSAHFAPPSGVTSAGTGIGIFSLEGNWLRFNIVYSSLSGTPNMAHIHGPAGPKQNAGILIDLGPYNGGTWGTNGTLSGVLMLTDTQRALILGGKTYVNIHTSVAGTGEIRGQIAPVNMQAVLKGNGTPAHGLGNLTLVGNQLTMNVTYRGLSGVATAAHIHGPASRWQDAPVMQSLAGLNGGAFGQEGIFSGTVSLTAEQLAAVIEGLTYINIHTLGFQGGEIRGQVVAEPAAVPFSTLMSGLAERPNALTNTAFGDGTFSLEGLTLNFNIRYGGLGETANNAHIHGPTNTAGNAPVMIDLRKFHTGAFGTSGAFSGSVTLTPAQRNAMLSGLAYVNVHTPSNPGGEVRGQIMPVLLTTTVSGRNERPSPTPSDGTGFGLFNLVRDRLTMSVAYAGLLSPATMAHIHGPASATGSAGILVNLLPYNGGAYGASGSFSGTAVLEFPVLQAVLDGRTYLNLHTTNYTGGEIRGQLVP